MGSRLEGDLVDAMIGNGSRFPPGKDGLNSKYEIPLLASQDRRPTSLSHNNIFSAPVIMLSYDWYVVLSFQPLPDMLIGAIQAGARQLHRVCLSLSSAGGMCPFPCVTLFYSIEQQEGKQVQSWTSTHGCPSNSSLSRISISYGIRLVCHTVG